MAGAVGIRVGGFERTFRDEEARTLIATKANSADVYTKAEADIRLNEKADAQDVYTKDELDAVIGDINAYGLGLGQEIPANADLNDYKKPGKYFIAYGNVASIVNAPSRIATSSLLIVDTVAYGYLQQRYVVGYPSGEGFEFVRRFAGSAWGGWECVSTASPYTLGLGIAIPENADLDAYTTPGVYTCNTNAIAATLSNAPINIAFTLIVRKPFSSAYAVQELIPYKVASGSNGSHWTRTKNLNDGYESWVCDGGINSIVAEDATNGWHWVKYANGVCVLDFRAQNSTKCNATTWSTSTGGISYTTYTINTPFTLTTLISKQVNRYGGSIIWAINGDNESGGTAFKIRLVTTLTNIGQQTYDNWVTMHLVGTWK